MKKNFTALLFLIVTSSCKKENTSTRVCYHCTFGVSASGYQKPALDTCVNHPVNIDTLQFTDPAGSPINSACH